jgi:trans-aconitate methyltransferase
VPDLDAIEWQWQEDRPDLRQHPARFGWEPYPPAEFSRLLDAAVAVAPARTFLDAGCGPGTKCLMAAARGLVAAGVELVPEYADAARACGVDVTVCDVAEYDGYQAWGIVYVNCPYRREPDEICFETWLHGQLSPGAVLLAVNSRIVPGGWRAVVHEPGEWRGVYVKPG